MKNKVNFKKLLTDFFYANTPRDLYRKYRSDYSVQNLCNIFTLDELINKFTSLQNKKSVESEVSSYIILASVSFLNYENQDYFLQSVDLSCFTWTKIFAEYIKEDRPSIQSINIKPKILNKDSYSLSTYENTSNYEIYISKIDKAKLNKR